MSVTFLTNEDAAGFEKKTNRVTTIDETSDDEHYPTALAVYNALGSGGGGGGGHYEIGKNKFNVNAITTGKYINYNNAVVGKALPYTDNEQYSISDWITVNEGESYNIGYDGTNIPTSVYCVDSDELLVEKFGVARDAYFTVPVGTKKVRLGHKTSIFTCGTFQMEVGTEATEYEPYTETYVSTTDFTGVEEYAPLVEMVNEKVNSHIPAMASEATAGVARIWTTDNGDGTVNLHIDTTGEV